MPVSLYWNCKLLREIVSLEKETPVTSPKPFSDLQLNDISAQIFSHSFRPFYPRAVRSSDANFQFNQFEILIASIKSHLRLDFTYIRANFDLGPFDNIENRIFIQDLLIQCAQTSKHVDISWKRPSSISEWLCDSRKFSAISGMATPTVYHFNHDHLFVGEPSALYQEAKRHENFDPIHMAALQTPYIITLSSHYSEYLQVFRCISLGLDNSDSTVKPLTDSSKQSLVDSYVCKIGRQESIFGIAGEFISQSGFLHYFWSKALLTRRPIPDYLPRPDWPCLTHPFLELPFLLPNSELFAHYDGLGRESLLFDLVEPLELSFVANPNSNISDTCDPIHYDECLKPLYKYFMRTRAVFFESVIKHLLSKPAREPFMVSIYSVLRHTIIPQEVLNFLRHDVVAKKMLSMAIADCTDINEGIVSVRLTESSLLKLPHIYISAVLTMQPGS
jgi:hypothetical protein